MKHSRTHLDDFEWLSIVPAGGFGTRLGKLTTDCAKPALPIAFDEHGNLTRMIDIPLVAIGAAGGGAIVSRCFAADTLEFVAGYDHVVMVDSQPDDSPIDTMLQNIALIERSMVDHVGLIPGDTDITRKTLEEMRIMLDMTGADAVLLATRHLEGHNVRDIDRAGMMTARGSGAARLGDMGIHMFRREWLLERLYECLRLDPAAPREVWNDIYNIDQPAGKIYLYAPTPDLEDVDLGTIPAFLQAIEQRNDIYRDGNGNIVFPGASLHPDSRRCVALPGSRTDRPLRRAIIPANVIVKGNDDYLLA